MKESFVCRLCVAAVFITLASACGSKNNFQPNQANAGAPNSDSQAVPLPPEVSATTGDYAWLVGTWKLKGMAISLGDLGASIQEMKVTPTEAWVEKFGHLAAESWGRFNKDGFDYGGNCLFKVHSKDFAIEIINNANDPSETTKTLVFNTRFYELIDNQGNRSDCDQQIARMNQIITGEPRYIVGSPVETDSNSFQLDAANAYLRKE